MNRPDIPPVPVDSDWFPIRVTLASLGAYLFQEVWAIPSGLIADKIGGRVNTVNDPAYAIDGAVFAATAAGTAVQALARRAVGAGGIQWELKGFAAAGLPIYGINLPNIPISSPTAVPSGTPLIIPIGTFYVFAMGFSLSSGGTSTLLYGVNCWDGFTLPAFVSGGTQQLIPAGSVYTNPIISMGTVANDGTKPIVALFVQQVAGVGVPSMLIEINAIPVVPSAP
jgi:hypothetical protein